MLFYDFEVFKYDWLRIIMDTDTHKANVIVNNPEELKAFYENNKCNI
ncbi:hypothetical protein ACJDU8_21950 [Clostridium sp. WILCCON 0269]|uniref:Uncharacterized protein n=1 Tax=Candidatus Clostridium eludens TaxID=3381663 RepID=A0ABW8SSP5_9CLOT